MNGYADYLLLLRPDERLCLEVKSYKNFAAQIIGDYPSMQSTAHITVDKYPRKKPYIFRPAVDNLQAKLRGMPPIILNTNNFKHFIHKNNTFTIYAAIEATHQSDTWFTTLSKHLHISKSQLTPHITIARTIDENCFFRLWPHFKFMNFRQQFVVNSLTILERETLNSRSKWSIYREINFARKPTEQLV